MEEMITARWEYDYVSANHMDQINYLMQAACAEGWAPTGGPCIVVRPGEEDYIVQAIARMQVSSDGH